MEIEYTKTIWIEPSDIDEMVSLVKRGLFIFEAIEEVACGWDDCDYYCLNDTVIKVLTDEIKRRIEND